MAGTFLVVGLEPERFAYPDTLQFKRPELFANINGQIISVPVEPENPLCTAAMTLEDHYGMIDKVINNGYCVEKLEKPQTETYRTAPEKRPSIRERPENANQECAGRKSPDKPIPQKKLPERGQEISITSFAKTMSIPAASRAFVYTKAKCLLGPSPKPRAL